MVDMVRKEDSDGVIDLNVEPESSVNCSICLDLVIYGAERSWAKLKCGHEFHLDCIGSAFNMKGMMQCPNCRTVEKGQWLYSTNSSPELGVDDISVDNYPFYFSFPEMPYPVHVCPFRGFTQVHPSTQSSVGVMNTLNPMIPNQNSIGSSPHPHGWVQYHHSSYLHQHQAPGIPMPRFMPSGQVYDPNPAFSHFTESPPRNYSHLWSRDIVPHFPML